MYSSPMKKLPRIGRRQFIRGMGAAAACARSATVRAQSGSDAPFQLAVHSGMFRRFRGPEMFQRVRDAGYRFIELSGGQIRSAAESAENAESLLQQMSAADLQPVSAFVVHRIASGDEAERAQAVAAWKRSLRGVRRLGVKHLGTEMTGHVAKPAEGEKAFRKSMEELLPMIESAGLQLSIEPHPGDFFEDAASTLELIRSLGSRSVSYLHCTPHTFYLGEQISKVIEEAGDLLGYVHVSDSFRTERIMDRFGGGVGLHLHLEPGLGEVDFGETFEALERIGYRGPVSLQAISHPDTPLESAIRSRQYFETLLGSRLKS